MFLQKPKRLQPGDSVAVLSLSWGGPAAYPALYELGVENLRTHFGLKVVELETARLADAVLHRNPRLRAEDLNRAVRDPSIKAVFSSVGGYDSVRILPYVDWDAIRANPKVIMGYSDTTTVLTHASQRGLVTFYGPSVMTGIAQLKSLPPVFEAHLRSMLFEDCGGYLYAPYETWSDWYPDWGDRSRLGQVNGSQPNSTGWKWLQGRGAVTGRLWGGCIEVLEFLKGTDYWPDRSFWNERIVFFESSEAKPSVQQIVYILRNYGVAGVFERASAILYARPKGYSDSEKEELYAALKTVIGEEFGQTELPIVANMDFGHTDPKLVLPLGAQLRIDCERRELTVMESFTDPATTP